MFLPRVPHFLVTPSTFCGPIALSNVLSTIPNLCSVKSPKISQTTLSQFGSIWACALNYMAFIVENIVTPS